MKMRCVMDLMRFFMCVCAAAASDTLRSSGSLLLSNGLCQYSWTRKSQEQCRPICELGCKHGECIGPDLCRCHPGYTGKTCNQDVNECAFRPCKYRCMNTLGSYKCYCLNGYMMMADGTCRNARTCAMANCQYGCAVMKGEVRCQCPSPGLRLAPDGRTCVDVDECVSGRAQCPRFRKCVNTFSSYICRCHNGFELRHINGKYHCTDKKDVSICYDKPAHKKCKCKASANGKGYDCKSVVKVTIEPARPVEVTISPTTVSTTASPMTTTPQTTEKTTTTTISTSTTIPTTSVAITTSVPISTAVMTTLTPITVAMTTTTTTTPTTIPTTTAAMTTTTIPTTITPTSVAMTTTIPTAITTTTAAMTTTIPTAITTTSVAMTTTIPTAITTTSAAMTTTTTTIPTTITTTVDTTTSPTTRSTLAVPTTTTATTAIITTTTATTAATTTPEMTSATPESTTTLDNRVHRENTAKPRGDVHIPRYENDLFDWDFDVELGNTADYRRDDPEAGVVSCSFDEGLCVWITDSEGDLPWKLKDDPAGGQYLTVPEATNRSIRGARLTVHLAPPKKPWQGGDLCLAFRHRLHGHHIGSLQLFVRKGRSHSSSVWNRTGGQGWRHTHITIGGRSLGDIVVKGERRRGKHGEIAVDDFSLRRGTCSDTNDRTE
ncbi:nephronectin [Xyrauchen texanus]|uniref:nephronectin n=1 Tax=Xyrauchen texanus TaxID=154827 RepID=UPI0022425C59|nr:nephronectin [Xyrauchen texanus]